MNEPSECKWCGADHLISPQLNMIWFECWTYYDTSVDAWNQDEACVDRMAEQAKILRERVRQAVEALLAIQRHEVTPYNNRHVNWEQTSVGPWVLQREVEAVVDELVRTLEGET